MATPTWEFEVEEVFPVAVRGTGVFGRLTGTIPSSPVGATVHASGPVPVLADVWVDLARAEGREELVLLLREVEKDAVPVGAVIRAAGPDA